ncbi:hypothetical protein Tco_0548269 [Tanacetum coccineum]
MPNPNPIMSNSPTLSSFLKDCTMHISYKNAKMFADNVLPNYVGGEEFNKFDDIGTERMTKKEIKKNDNGMPKEPNKELNWIGKVVHLGENTYQFYWHLTIAAGNGGGCLEAKSIDLTRLC